MSNFLAIATVTSALSQTILPAAKAAVTGAEVTTKRPDDPQGESNTPRVNLYLYQVTPNSAWRNADLPTRRQNGALSQRPQAALDLHYLLTFYGNEIDLEPQRLLGRTVSLLHAQPVLTRQQIETTIGNADGPDSDHYLKKSNLAEQDELVRFVPLSFNLEELSKLWSVLIQTPYTLSVAYKASVVLIEEENIPKPSLPVRGYNVYVEPIHQPVIEQIISASGEDEPIFANSTLLIRGKRLLSKSTQVRIGSLVETPDPENVNITEVNLPLPLGLQAGVHGAQIIHPRMIGTPTTLHKGIESNVVAFVLRPTITIGQDPVTNSELPIKFVPNVGKSQRVVLLLNEFDPPSDRPPYAYIFDAPTNNGIEDAAVNETDMITFPIHGMQPEDYLVRVQVDGAESVLKVDTTGRYSDPFVTIS
jgi:hypothetical protein